MLHVLPRLMTVAAMFAGAFLSAYFIWQSHRAYKELSFAAQEALYESLREPASSVSKTVALVSMQEVFANVNSGTGVNRKMHTLGVRLDIELFEEESRQLLEEKSGGIKHAIITTAVEQDFDWINTIAGKLYFKEVLVARINEYFHRAIVRDVHFASFYLQ